MLRICCGFAKMQTGPRYQARLMVTVGGGGGGGAAVAVDTDH